MNTCTPARRNRLPLGTFALLFAVFLWGSQYKISLYHSKDHPSSPPAKLLSEAQSSSSARATISFLNAQLKLPVLFVVPSVRNAGPGSNESYALLELPRTHALGRPVRSNFLPRPPPQI
jgi:hypothetical protein